MTTVIVRESLKKDFVKELERFASFRNNDTEREIVLSLSGFNINLEGEKFQMSYESSSQELWFISIKSNGTLRTSVIGKHGFRLTNVDLLNGIPIVSLAKLQDAMDEMIITNVIES